MKTLCSGALLAILLLSFIVAGCSDREKRPENPPARRDTMRVYNDNDTLFHLPEFFGNRHYDTTLTVDLDGDGRDERIVTSLLPDSVSNPWSVGRADLVQIFSYDPASRRYSQILADSLAWASEFKLRDVTGDGLPELVVPTYSGGNDITASYGLTIYSGAGGTIRTIFKREEGDPLLTTLDHVGGEAVMVHDLFWPLFASHAGAEQYLADILAFRDGGYVSIRKEQRALFAQYAESGMKEYRTVYSRFADVVTDTDDGQELTEMETADELSPLFKPVAMVMIYYGHGGDLRSLRSFWSSERKHLVDKLLPTQIAELDTIYARMIAL